MAKKKKVIDAHIENEIYNFGLVVSFNQSDKKFKEMLESLLIEYRVKQLSNQIFELDSYQAKQGRTLILDEERMIVMRLNFMPSMNDEYAMLQHEIFHVVDFILDEVGLPLISGSEEAYAYMTQYYTEKIYDLISE